VNCKEDISQTETNVGNIEIKMFLSIMIIFYIDFNFVLVPDHILLHKMKIHSFAKVHS